MRLLYHMRTEGVPPGIDFSPEGDKLFVGSAVSNLIAAYDVDGFMIRRHTFVLQTGHGHAAMVISRRRRVENGPESFAAFSNSTGWGWVTRPALFC